MKLVQKGGGIEVDLRTRTMFNSCCRTNIFLWLICHCNLQTSSVSFTSVESLLSAQHLGIQEILHKEIIYIPLQILEYKKEMQRFLS